MDFFFSDTIKYIGYLVLTINTFIYFKSNKKKSVAFEVFSFYLIGILIIQFITNLLADIRYNNLFLSHYYFIGQFILLSFFFKEILKKKSQKKTINLLLIIVLITLGIYYFLNPEMYFEFNQLEIILTSVPLLIYSLFFFIQKIDDSNKQFLYLTSGLFIYILCSTLLFVSGDIGIGSSLKRIIWQLNSVLYLLYQILVFIEWYKNFRKNI